MTKVTPVIHHLDQNTTFNEVELISNSGADGLFLISHHGDDDVLPFLAIDIKQKHPDLFVGINLLNTHFLTATEIALNLRLDAIWLDHAGISGKGANEKGTKLIELVKNKPIKVFASVAFKYQIMEDYPAEAAKIAAEFGLIPTTSGDATGSPPSVSKIESMSNAARSIGGSLAVASGMDCDNVIQYTPYLDWILVATGISKDAHHLDEKKLNDFVAIVNRRQKVSER